VGDDIELRDANGNLVRVPLYPALASIGAFLAQRALDRQVESPFPIESGTTCTVVDRNRVERRLVVDLRVHTHRGV